MPNTTITPSAAGLGVEQQQYTAPGAGSLGASGVAGAGILGNVAAPLVAALALTGIAALVARVGTPANATLALQGSTPLVQLSGGAIIAPPGAALIVTTFNQSPAIAPPAGGLVLTGLAQVNNSRAVPAAGVLRMTLQGVGGVLAPAGAALSFTGAAPIAPNAMVVPAVGALNAGGLAVSQILGVAPPPVGVLGSVGYAPTVTISANFVALPGAGGIAAAGASGYVIQGLTPSGASLGIAGAAPKLAAFDVLQQGALALTGVAPISVQGIVITPTWATLALTGVGPPVQNVVTPAAGTLGLSGSPPTYYYGPVVVPLTGALVAASAPVSLRVPQTVQPGAGAISIVGNAGQVNSTLIPSAGVLQSVGAAPQVSERVVIGAVSLSFSGTAPSLGFSITPATGQLGLSASTSTLNSNALFVPASASLAAVGVTPSANVNASPAPARASLGISGYAPVLNQTFNGVITPVAGAIGVAGTLAHTLQTCPTTTIFTDMVLLRAPVAGASLQGGPLPYGTAYQAVAEQIPYGIDWEDWLALRWQPGTAVTVGQVIRPSVPNGYEFICITGGETGGTEPGWPPFLGSTVLDGSAQWQCQALSTDSLETSIQDITWTAGPGLVLSGSLLAGQTSIITIDTTNAVSGMDYALKCAALMADGQQKVGTIIIKVR